MSMRLVYHAAFYRTLTLLLGLILLALPACKRHPNTPPPSGAITFEPAGVALVPGEDWKQIREPGFAGTLASGELCLPVLQGENQLNGSLIQTYLDRADKSDPKRAAQKLLQTIEKNPNLLKTSLRQESFNSEQGAAGVHLSFNQKMELPTRKWLARTHIYLVRNRRDQIVTICYVTIADRESPAVHQMIRQTLSLR